MSLDRTFQSPTNFLDLLKYVLRPPNTRFRIFYETIVRVHWMSCVSKPDLTHLWSVTCTRTSSVPWLSLVTASFALSKRA